MREFVNNVIRYQNDQLARGSGFNEINKIIIKNNKSFAENCVCVNV